MDTDILFPFIFDTLNYLINEQNGINGWGWRHFVDNDISLPFFFKMGDFPWTLSKGDNFWLLLVDKKSSFGVSFRGHFLGEF